MSVYRTVLLHRVLGSVLYSTHSISTELYSAVLYRCIAVYQRRQQRSCSSAELLRTAGAATTSDSRVMTLGLPLTHSSRVNAQQPMAKGKKGRKLAGMEVIVTVLGSLCITKS